MVDHGLLIGRGALFFDPLITNIIEMNEISMS